MPQLIDKMSTADQALRVNEAAVASIYMAYYAFYVSDINGSIPYSQAFKARYGGTLTPTYDTQQSLFDTLDTQIKAAVTALEVNLAGQKSYGNSDPFYVGHPTHCIKDGHAFRMSIAMR